jgi:hypothetical protein
MWFDVVETNSKNLYRGIIEYKNSYQLIMNLVKDGNALAYSHNILNRWKNFFNNLFNVHSVNDRQTEIHVAEPLLPPQFANEKLKRRRR